jgi:hypothetical protein
MFPLARISRYRGRLRKVASILAASLLCGAIADAQPSLTPKIVDYPSSNPCQGAATPLRTTDVTYGNQYVLLLFFQASAAPAVHKLFQTQPPIDQNGNQQPPLDGCWKDPGDSQRAIGSSLLRIQGGCPTDCVKPAIAGVLSPKSGKKSHGQLKTTRHSHYPGDPLRDYGDAYWWGLFFADPAGDDYADDDARTKFAVWQIVVQDSLQAGRVLNSLYTDPTSQALFSAGGGYLGHIMVGFKSPPPPKKQPSP